MISKKFYEYRIETLSPLHIGVEGNNSLLSDSEVYNLAKKGGVSYLPGEILKRALKTIILGALLGKFNRKVLQRKISEELNKEGSSEKISDILEKIVFGSTSMADFMDSIKISDACQEEDEEPIVKKVKTIWKEKGEITKNEREYSMEFIPPFSTFKGNISINWEQIESALQQSEENQDLTSHTKLKLLNRLFSNLNQVLKKMNLVHVGEEKKFFQDIEDSEFRPVIEFYNWLKKENLPAFQLGRFTGCPVNTVNEQAQRVERDLLEGIIKSTVNPLGNGSHNVRRLIISDPYNSEEQLEPPGWVKFEIQ